MTTQELASRLTTLQENHKQVSQLITRLSKLPAQPGSTSPSSNQSDVRLELSEEIHQSLKEQEEDLELVRQEVEDTTSGASFSPAARRRDSVRERDRTSLETQVARLGEDLKVARAQFRRAQLQAKRNAEAAKRKERELLFSGVEERSASAGSNRRRGQEKLTEEELELNASNDVVAAMRRVHQSMQSELSRSQYANETLQQSQAALTSLSESYSSLDSLLSSSRSLLSTLVHSQKSDTWYLETAFYILLATISWLVFRRILYGPGWWLVYQPIRLTLRLCTLTVQALFAVFTASGNKTTNSTSLVVQRSATGGFPTFQPGMAAPSQPAGAGGEGAKKGLMNEGEKTISEEVGRMAEDSRREDSSGSPVQETVLKDRTDEPPNPKKRMFEDVPPAASKGHEKDEL